MSWTLTSASIDKLRGVHPDLVCVVRAAAARCPQPFVVYEGVRSLARERELMAEGKSALRDPTHCRHVPSMDRGCAAVVGHAVDLVPLVGGQPKWLWPQIYPIAAAMKASAAELHVPMEWGGDWRFKDGAHYQLTWKAYP